MFIEPIVQSTKLHRSVTCIVLNPFYECFVSANPQSRSDDTKIARRFNAWATHPHVQSRSDS